MERVLKVFKNHREQEDETRRYWLTKTIAEKMEETASLIRYAYSLQGVDIDAQRSERTLVSTHAHNVEYLIVGGHAVNAHGVPRSTKDLDVLVRPEHPNSERVFAALAEFGVPLGPATEADFRGGAGQVFQVGVEPNRIDILQSIDGVSFEDAWRHRIVTPVDGELSAPFLGRDELIRNKESTGRARDLADVEELREVERVRRAEQKSVLPPNSATP